MFIFFTVSHSAIYTVQQSWTRDNFLASRQRQRDNVIEPRGQEKSRKIFRSRCLDGVAKQIQ